MLRLLLASFATIYLALSACADCDSSQHCEQIHQQIQETNKKSFVMKITIGNQAITALMEDNVAAKDLLSRLPIETTLEDFNRTTEKIFYPNPQLNTQGAPMGCAPVPGDITIYAPWGNIAIFCKNWPYSNDLIKIGHINKDGIKALQVPGNMKVKIEKF